MAAPEVTAQTAESDGARSLSFPAGEAWVNDLPFASRKLKAEWQAVFAPPVQDRSGHRHVILQTTSQERYRVASWTNSILELSLWALRGSCNQVPRECCTVECLVQRHVHAALAYLNIHGPPSEGGHTSATPAGAEEEAKADNTCAATVGTAEDICFF
jgi:hypothetical protein